MSFPNDYSTDLNVVNGCMVNSVAFQDYFNNFHGDMAIEAEKNLKKYSTDRWSRVMVVEWLDGINHKNDHALCWFEHEGNIWCYDPMFGSRDITPNLELKADPYALSKLWRPDLDIQYAQFGMTSSGFLYAEISKAQTPTIEQPIYDSVTTP